MTPLAHCPDTKYTHSNRVRKQLCILWLLILAAGAPLHSQMVPYPSTAGRGLPEHRRQQKTDSATTIRPSMRYEGKLQTLDNKTIALTLNDSRLLLMNRSGKTKFYRESREIKSSMLNIGDTVSVETTLDDQGMLYALKVTFETAPLGDEQNDTSRDSEESKSAPLTSVNARYTLRTGPPPTEAGQPEPPETSRFDNNGSLDSSTETAPGSDSLIDKAVAASFSFSDTLPNFICLESMTRFATVPSVGGWKFMDVVSAAIIYEDGQESYRDVKLNEMPTNKKLEELSGSWSTGEFATTLTNLFHPATAATFHLAGEATMQNMRAKIYNFEVEQRNSHWNVQSGSQSLIPAYRGSVWIAADSGRVLRIETQALNLPTDFPMDSVESAVDYSFVSIDGESVLLPAHAEGLGCQRGGFCTRNVIEFRHYRKYTSDSTIIFDR